MRTKVFTTLLLTLVLADPAFASLWLFTAPNTPAGRKGAGIVLEQRMDPPAPHVLSAMLAQQYPGINPDPYPWAWYEHNFDSVTYDAGTDSLVFTSVLKSAPNYDQHKPYPHCATFTHTSLWLSFSTDGRSFDSWLPVGYHDPEATHFRSVVPNLWDASADFGPGWYYYSVLLEEEVAAGVPRPTKRPLWRIHLPTQTVYRLTEPNQWTPGPGTSTGLLIDNSSQFSAFFDAKLLDHVRLAKWGEHVGFRVRKHAATEWLPDQEDVVDPPQYPNGCAWGEECGPTTTPCPTSSPYWIQNTVNHTAGSKLDLYSIQQIQNAGGPALGTLKPPLNANHPHKAVFHFFGKYGGPGDATNRAVDVFERPILWTEPTISGNHSYIYVGSGDRSVCASDPNTSNNVWAGMGIKVMPVYKEAGSGDYRIHVPQWLIDPVNPNWTCALGVPKCHVRSGDPRVYAFVSALPAVLDETVHFYVQQFGWFRFGYPLPVSYEDDWDAECSPVP